MSTLNQLARHRIIGLIVGSVVGDVMFGFAGLTHVSNGIMGSLCGILIGGVIGYGRVA